MTQNGLIELEPEIKVLRAKARDALPDCVITDPERYDTVNDDGEKIREIAMAGPQGTTKTIEDNVTVPYKPTVSTTGDVGLLVLEAEMQAEGRELGNPHIPATTEARDKALDRIKSAGLSPAWEQ